MPGLSQTHFEYILKNAQKNARPGLLDSRGWQDRMPNFAAMQEKNAQVFLRETEDAKAQIVPAE